MIDVHNFEDFELLRETVDIECKLAAGRNGKGALPEDFWPTYSSFANTQGGLILLGVRERDGKFSPEGIEEWEKVKQDIFSIANNIQKVSVNLLSNKDVQEFTIDGRTILAVFIHRASRQQRPVHLTTNPFKNTYRRLHDGDRITPDEDVRRMIAERVEDSRDTRILPDFTLDDLCITTFHDYRQAFASRDPTHTWNTVNDNEFIRQIGGWRRDRSIGQEGLTVAGLLMFGWQVSIQEVLPHYMLDYQERPEARTELRWKDRITLDGKWSGNLYDFYRRVYGKLTSELKVPFLLESSQRKDETPIHEALREALANTLVHADYSGRASILVVKRPDMYGFRNPGVMRVPPELAIRGGDSDCRNRTLHKMFRFVGLGEQAGSGVPKIYSGWAGQHWRAPALYEKSEPFDQTLLELRMENLLPSSLVESLRNQFGEAFDQLPHAARLTLAAAGSERTVSHARVLEMTGSHPVEATRMLRDLVHSGYLESHNLGRGMVYCLPGSSLPRPEDIFGEHQGPDVPSHLRASTSGYLIDSSGHLVESSGRSSPDQLAISDAVTELARDEFGQLVSEKLDAPVIDSLEALHPALRSELEQLASLAKAKRKLAQDDMQLILLQLCAKRYITLSCLAGLVHRSADVLRKSYLKPLTSQGRVRLAFPTTPNHMRQAYRTSAEDEGTQS